MSRRRSHRERQRRQRRVTYIVGGILVIGIVAVFVVLALRPIEAPIPNEAVARYEGIPQSISEEGYPILGDPEAPIQIVEYSSFDCPSCAVFHDEVIKSLVPRVRDGEFALIYKPIFGTGNISDGEQAARAALCAGQQGAFWSFHDALFDWQEKFLTQAYVSNRLKAGVEQLGIDVAQWENCLQSDLIDDTLAFAREDARNENEYNGTPAVYINGLTAAPTLGSINTVLIDAQAELDADAQVQTDESDVVDDITPDEAADDTADAETVNEPVTDDADATPDEAAEESTATNP
ncbi:MAG: hypothetical protein D6737_12210 [Chloroflexi bacterium]|nr:MAG: hypothetical protein D6737_12210 [Chloroflexota bacterium]